MSKLAKLFNVCISYISCLCFRNSKKVIFGSWFGNKFADNSKYLFKSMLVDKRLRAIWITKNIDIYNEMKKQGYEVYIHNSLKGIYHQLTASKYCTCTGKDDVSYYLLGNAKHIELWHGIPLKKIMYDDNINNNHKDNDDDNILKKILKGPEAKSLEVVSTSDRISQIYTSAFRINKNKILQFGQPRNDVFFNDDIEDNNFPKEYKEKNIILYMPTHRKEGKVKFDIDKILDLRKINELCKKNNMLFLIKKHYYHNNENINLGDFSNILDITNEEYDSQMLLKYTDILITDYSSCYIDYLLLDRPIIFYNFDYDDYLETDREMYFDYETITPGNKVSNYEELESEIKSLINNSDSLSEERKKVRNLLYDKQNQNIVANRFINYLI